MKKDKTGISVDPSQPTLVLGLMSGTSLDGLDLALCRFSEQNDRIHYEVLAAETISYPSEWKNLLAAIHRASAEKLALAHSLYGEWLGHEAKNFLSRHAVSETVDAVASHGHTIFHQPQHRMSFQLGSGAALAVASGLTTVSDFRTTDVALHGQGAPLVPAGDELLFGNYAACLNIGGIANISFRQNDQRIAFDICAANIVLNHLSLRAGKTFDENGEMARSGKPVSDLINELNAVSFYREPAPKSLGRENVEQTIFPIIEKFNASPADLMHSYVIHIATQIANALPENFSSQSQMLVTGGGAHHTYLIEEIKNRCRCEIVVPDKRTIDFKEAVVFAFLGWLRLNERNNALKSVTGATRDSCGGCVYLP